jgi:coproporphyrinogen III oxidase-like Fe-S oxidoreductase
LAQARRLFPISRISIETNPNHLRNSNLRMMQEIGVSRLSVGVQSLDDDLLREIGRFQPYGGSREILQRLQQTQGRFDTFNVDMMFNFPHQSIKSLLRDILLLKSLKIDQISYYPLMPADSKRLRISKQIGVLDFNREREMYRIIDQALRPEYHPTTAWCFSRRDRSTMIDEYITQHQEYVGIGSGSFSYLQGSVYASSFSIREYLERVRLGLPGIMAGRRLSRKEQAQYDFLMNLFGGSLQKAYMQARYGAGFEHLLRKELSLFKWLGAIEETDEAYRLTRQGRYYWVLMMREFFIAVNNLRLQMGNLAGAHEHA